MKKPLWRLTSVLAALLGASVSSAAHAQALLHAWDDVSHAFDPTLTRSVSDLDGDGHRDLVFLGANGAARAESSAHRGQVLVDYRAGEPALDYARHVAPIDDIDGDGIDELAFVCARNGDLRASIVRVLSGRDGSPVLTLAPGGSPHYLPHYVERGGDANGDGVGDVLVESGGLDWPDPAFVRIYSGADGAVLREFPSTRFFQVQVLGDLDGDGASEYVVAGPSSLRVLRGVDGVELHRSSSLVTDFVFGWFVSVIGDEDGDGVRDLATSAWTPQIPCELRIFSGANGGLLRTLAPPSLQVMPFFNNTALYCCGDYDGDGTNDYACRLTPYQRIATISGATGATLDQLGVPQSGYPFDIGDLNNDGITELGVTSIGYGGPHSFASAYTILLGQRQPTTICSAAPQPQDCTPSASTVGGVSLSVGDPLKSTVLYAPQAASGVLVWSTSRTSLPSNGLSICIGSPRRAIRVTTDGTPGSSFCYGSATVEWSRDYFAELGLTAGDTLYTQWAIRDPLGATPILVSDATEITLAP